MHKESSVFGQCLVDRKAVKVKFLCQVDGITSLLHGVPQLDLTIDEVTIMYIIFELYLEIDYQQLILQDQIKLLWS